MFISNIFTYDNKQLFISPPIHCTNFRVLQNMNMETRGDLTVAQRLGSLPLSTDVPMGKGSRLGWADLVWVMGIIVYH